MKYYYADAGNNTVGPHSEDSLRQLHSCGVINDATLVIAEGGSQWSNYQSINPPRRIPPAPVRAVAPPMYASAPSSEVVSIGSWLGTIILIMIPVVNLIALLIWAFGGDVNPSKRNFARAYLWIIGVLVVLTVFVVIIAAAAASGSH